MIQVLVHFFGIHQLPSPIANAALLLVLLLSSQRMVSRITVIVKTQYLY